MKLYFIKRNTLLILIAAILGILLLVAGFHNQIKQLTTRTINQSPNIEVTPNPNNIKDVQTNKPGIEAKKKPKSSNSNFFIEYRLSKDRNRDRQLELLSEIVNNSNSGDEARKEAQKRILNISKNMEREAELEKLIEARGYKDSVSVLQDTSATIIVKLPSLSAEDSSKITSIVEQFTGIDRAKIVVLAKM